MAHAKLTRSGKGRPVGAKNKLSIQVKEAILEAAIAAGGKEGMVGYLKAQATLNPSAFMALLGKIVPQEMKSDATASGKTVINILTGVPRKAAPQTVTISAISETASDKGGGQPIEITSNYTADLGRPLLHTNLEAEA